MGGPAPGYALVVLWLEHSWFVRGAWYLLNEAVFAQLAFRRC